MKLSHVVAVMLLACCVAFAAANAAPLTFADWMDQQSSPLAKISSDSDEYESAYPPVEHTEFCLKVSENSNCDTRPKECTTCDFEYREEKLTCCNGIQTHGNYYYPDGDKGSYTDDDGGYRPDAPTINIGTCDVEWYEFDNKPTTHPGCVKWGSFKKICNIAHGSLCGAPFCDGLILHQEGYIYETTVISETDEDKNVPTDVGTCIDKRKLRMDAMKKGSKKSAQVEGYGSYPAPAPAPAPAPKKVCDLAEDADGNKASGAYFKGTAHIWTGPVTVYSRKHHFSYHFGTMQYVDDWDRTTCSDDTKLPKVEPYQYKIKLNKPQGHYN